MTRQEQTKRGLEGIKMLKSFFEVNDIPFSPSSGSYDNPDIISKPFGIEVKRVEFLCKHRFNKRENFYIHLGDIKLCHESWNGLKEWCKKKGYIPLLIIVLTFKRQKPIFVRFTRKQIDSLQKEQLNNKWIKINAWNILIDGKILTGETKI